ncbi:hypothetical protein, partial [Pseudomonas aeruginosa]|uniref:hypothetical protein n=1 Tax=Pseudomonas aeruginosa TaxID=287 RepID=UPI0022371724
GKGAPGGLRAGREGDQPSEWGDEATVRWGLAPGVMIERNNENLTDLTRKISNLSVDGLAAG